VRGEGAEEGQRPAPLHPPRQQPHLPAHHRRLLQDLEGHRPGQQVHRNIRAHALGNIAQVQGHQPNHGPHQPNHPQNHREGRKQDPDPGRQHHRPHLQKGQARLRLLERHERVNQPNRAVHQFARDTVTLRY